MSDEADIHRKDRITYITYIEKITSRIAIQFSNISIFGGASDRGVGHRLWTSDKIVTGVDKGEGGPKFKHF